jgi:LysM repeat protein
MKTIIRNSLSWIILLALSGCLGSARGCIPVNSPVDLKLRTQNGSTTFSQAGEVITYNYVITNTGTTPLGGSVLVVDGTKQVSCPSINAVGNKNDNLDPNTTNPNETVTCTATYTISQADVNAGQVTNAATATVGGLVSNQASLTLTLGNANAGIIASTILKLTKTSSSATYGTAGEKIIYTYTITNTGTTPLGPTQFTVTDNKLAAPVNCGEGNTTLAPNQPVSCEGTYIITQADTNLAGVTNTATASGAGQTSAAVSVTIANLLPPNTQTPPTASPASDLTPGTTIQHRVAKGEWLIQIVRCYGASYSAVIAANPQIPDPNFIYPADAPNGTVVTVPNIGSSGHLYGPPCVVYYTVQSGDTWESIAQNNNADIVVLKKVNPVTLTAGTLIKIPKNSAGSNIGVGTTTNPPVGTTVVPTTSTAMRLTFGPGETTTARYGIINPNETLHYVVATSVGQTLSIKLTAPANEVAIGVNSPSGIALKQMDASPTWSTNITTGGDYAINLMSLTGGSSKNYTLEVTLTAQVPTATNTPTS